MLETQEKEAAVRNLKDAGCDDLTIRKYLDCVSRNDKKGGLRVLEEHRRLLLGSVHSGEKKIDCLDYFVYKLNKGE